MKAILYIIVSFFMLSISDINAQKVLTLKECIKIAQENSLRIKKGLLSKRASDIDLKYMKQQLMPSLNANSSLSYNIGRRIDPTTNSYLSQTFLSQGINLNTGIVLYNGGKLRNSIKKAILDKDASGEDVAQMKRDLALLVTNIYLSILYAQENLQNAEKQYISTQEQLNKEKKLIAAGLKPKSSALNVEAQLYADEQKVVEGKNNIERYYLELKSLLLLGDSERIEIKTPAINITEHSDVDELSLAQFYISALQHYPAYSAAELRLKSSELQRKIAKSSFYPVLSIGGGLSTNYADKALEIIGYNQGIREETFLIDNTEVPVGIPYQIPITQKQEYFNQLKNNLGFGMAIQVSIPIYNKYVAKANLQKAIINIENQRIAKEQIAQDLKSKIQLAYSESKAAKSQYLAAKKAFEAQKAAFNNAKVQYELGTLGSYDLINAKLMYDKAENSLLLSKYQYIFKVKILDFYLGKNLDFN